MLKFTLKLIVILLLFVSHIQLSLANNASVSESKIVTELLRDIKIAEKKLTTSQKSLTNARNRLAKKVREQEKKVAILREKSAVSQRIQDEKTLSLQQLQTRLKTWSEQNQYQQNILSRFNHNIAITPFSPKLSAQKKLEWLSQHITNIEESIYPRWKDERVVLPSG